MAHKKSSTTDIALRVATAMKQMGIDGLPRNYELVYEAYAGCNPDLVRDFIALGKYKTQGALDELGRKYLPGMSGCSPAPLRSTASTRARLWPCLVSPALRIGPSGRFRAVSGSWC